MTDAEQLDDLEYRASTYGRVVLYRDEREWLMNLLMDSPRVDWAASNTYRSTLDVRTGTVEFNMHSTLLLVGLGRRAIGNRVAQELTR